MNSRTRVARHDHGGGEGQPGARAWSLTSMSSAAGPPDLDVERRRARCGSARRARWPSSPCDVPAGTRSTTGEPGGVPGPGRRADHAVGRGDVGQPRRERGVVGVGGGDDGDGIGAAGREPLGQRRAPWPAPPRSGAACGRRRSRSGRRGTARRAGRARSATAPPTTHGPAPAPNGSAGRSGRRCRATGALGLMRPPTAARVAGSSVTAAAMRQQHDGRGRRCRTR